MENNKKKRKDVEPSKEEAALAMETIKKLQTKTDEDFIKKQELQEVLRKSQEEAAAEKKKIEAVQMQIQKKLRERLENKEKEKTEKTLKAAISFVEAPVNKKSKIKWKSLNGGNTLRGFLDDKFTFEITKGLNLFSLYIKDEEFKKKKKLNSYLGCSMNLTKLKQKSDKLV